MSPVWVMRLRYRAGVITQCADTAPARPGGMPGRAYAVISGYGGQDPCPALTPTQRNSVGLISDGGFQTLVACSKS